MRLCKQSLDEILNDENFVFADHFCYRKILGHGAFGYVVLAVTKNTLETMAVKVLINIVIDH